MAGVAVSAAAKAISGTLSAANKLINEIDAFIANLKSQTKARTKTATAAKTKAIKKTPNSSKYEEKPCVIATISKESNHVLVTNFRMTIDETANYVMSGGDVMCDTRSSAKKVAKRFSSIPIYHGPHNGGELGYYPHYHSSSEGDHSHIWFYSVF